MSDLSPRQTAPTTKYPTVKPPIKGYDYLDCPASFFFVEHPSGKSHLFDLGVRKDLESLASRILERIRNGGWKVEVRQNVADISREYAVQLESIDAIVWSHRDWDHTGAPITLPPTTALIVGTGFKKTYIPGYPENKDSPIFEVDDTRRDLVGSTSARPPPPPPPPPGRTQLSKSAVSQHTTTSLTALSISSTVRAMPLGTSAASPAPPPPPTHPQAADPEPQPSSSWAASCGPRLTSHCPSVNPLKPRSLHPCPGALFEAIQRRRSSTEPFLEVAVLPSGKAAAHDAERR